MLFVRTTVQVAVVFVLAVLFCIRKQSSIHVAIKYHELSLSTPDDMTGKSETLENIRESIENQNGVRVEITGASKVLVQGGVSDSLNLRAQIVRNQAIKMKRHKGSDDGIKRAMFVISMGEKAANTKTIERFVYSARNIGKYNGWIVVLTDAPSGRYDGMKNWTDHVIVMEPKEEDLKTHYNVSNMIYKRFKTFAIDYMDRDPRLHDVELVYYLDADIVFGDNMNKAFKGLETTYGIGPLGVNATNTTDLGKGKMWMFKGNSKKWHIQGGQIILERERSKPCLERWRKGFDAEETAVMGKDQWLLMDMKAEIEEARNKTNGNHSSRKIDLECEIVLMEQKPYIEFPLVKNIRKASKELNKNPKKKYTYLPMVHVRNDGGTAGMKDRYIRPYIRNLLRFKKNQRDTLGILEKVKMETTNIK